MASSPAGNARMSEANSGCPGSSISVVTIYIVPHTAGTIAVSNVARSLSTINSSKLNYSTLSGLRWYSNSCQTVQRCEVSVEDSVDRIIAQWAQVHPRMDVRQMGVLGRLSRLTRLFERELQQVFSQHGLQPGEFDILATLRRADVKGHGLTAGELAASAMVTAGAITNRLDRLVAKGLVTREPDPSSRRTIRVALTLAGRKVIDAAFQDHVANEERLLSSMTTDHREQLEELLRTLLHAHEIQK